MNLLFERAAALRAMLCFDLFQAPNSNNIDSVSSSDSAPMQQVRMHSAIVAPPPSPIIAPLPAAALASKNDFLQENDTVFGEILRGDRPARILGETNHVLAFQDLHPRARFHALVIPKRFIPSVFDLQQQQQDDVIDSSSSSNIKEDEKTTTTTDDLMLLLEMENMAMSLLEKYEPLALTTMADGDDDYISCFHVPPFNSVNHLHLHVLAPKREMSFFHHWIKYNVNTRWCTSLESVKLRLLAGKPAVPFQKP